MCIRDRINSPLGIGNIELSDGESVKGFICEGYGELDSEDITKYGKMCIRDRPVTVEVYNAPPVDLLDECVNHRPENYRAFENTWDYNNLLGL